MKTKRHITNNIAVTALAGLFLPAPNVLAESIGSASALLEEVVVTARKRGAEDVQDVPLAVSAFGADQLEAKFVTSIEDLSFSVPNASMDQVGTTPGVANFSVRGLGINNSVPGIDPTVGVFVDGLYLGMTYGVVLDTFDLEGVEVLRGPQGLLFGRNVTGGAVVMRTARPTGEFGGKVRARVTGGSDGGLEKNIAASLEGGLSDTLAVKMSAYWKDDDGWFENKFDGSNMGALETKILRPSLAWHPSDEFDLTVLLEHGETEGDGGVYQNRSDILRPDALKGHEISLNNKGYTDLEWNQAIVEANWQLGNGTLTNIMGWREVDHEGNTDIDGTEAVIFDGTLAPEQDQFSNELRYAGTIGDAWDITAGVYYFTQDIEYHEGRFILGGAVTAGLGAVQAHDTWGVFVNNDFSVTDAITLTAGVRYTKEKKDVKVASAPNAGLGIQGCSVTTLECTYDVVDNETWSNVTPKLGVKWQIDEEIQAYASWSKGFRSGGYNFRSVDPAVFPPGPTEEEELDSYEFGLKSTLLNNKLRINTALFRTEISNMQRSVNLPHPSLGLVQGIMNTADATIQGIEVDFVALISENFSVNGTLGLMDGDYDKIYTDLNGDSVISSADKALGIPRLAPKTWSIGAAYDIALKDESVVTLRVDYSYRDEVAFTDSNSTFLPDVEMLDVSARYAITENMNVSLYGKNLKDEVVVGAASLFSFGEAGAIGKGATYGVEFNYIF